MAIPYDEFINSLDTPNKRPIPYDEFIASLEEPSPQTSPEPVESIQGAPPEPTVSPKATTFPDTAQRHAAVESGVKTAQLEQKVAQDADDLSQSATQEEEQSDLELKQEFAWLDNPFKSNNMEVQDLIGQMVKLWKDPQFPPSVKLERLQQLKQHTQRVQAGEQGIIEAEGAALPTTQEQMFTGSTPGSDPYVLAETAAPEDVLRTVGAAATTVASMANALVKGVADLPIGVRPEIRQWLADNEQEIAESSAGFMEEIQAQAGMPAMVAQEVGQQALTTAIRLAAISGTGLTKGTSLIKNAVKLGLFTAATTSGDANERIKAGARSATLMSTPLLAGKIPNAVVAPLVDIGLNIGLSNIYGFYDWNKPESWIPALIMDTAFGVLTKPGMGQADRSSMMKTINGARDAYVKAVDGDKANAEFMKAAERAGMEPDVMKEFLKPVTQAAIADGVKEQPARVKVPAKEAPKATPEALPTDKESLPEAKDLVTKSASLPKSAPEAKLPAKMTPEEHIAFMKEKGRREYTKAPESEKPELMSLTQWETYSRKKAGLTPESKYTSKIGTERNHRDFIRWGIRDKLPLSSSAVAEYGIKLPEGYVREGNRYVFKGEPTPKPTIPESKIVEPPVKLSALVNRPLSDKQQGEMAEERQTEIKQATDEEKAHIYRENVKSSLGIEDAPLPDSKGGATSKYQAIVKSVKWTAQRIYDEWLSTSGLPRQTKGIEKALDTFNSVMRSSGLRISSNQKKLEAARLELGKNFQAENVNAKMNDVIDGSMGIDEFKQTFKVTDDNMLVKELKRSLQSRRDVSNKLVTLLEKGTPEQQKFAKKIANNLDTYITRFYRIHMQGESFTPNEKDVEAVKIHLKDQLVTDIGDLSKDLSGVKELTSMGLEDIDKVLTGKTSPIDFANKVFANEPGPRDELTSTMTELRRRYDRVSGMVKLEETPQGIFISAEPQRVADATKETFDILMDRQKSGKRVNPFLARHLDTPEVQRLFGMVTDPVSRMMMTSYMQENIYNLVKTTNDIYEGGRGKWWAADIDRTPEQRKYLTQRMPQNEEKYGNISGMMVSKPVHDMLTGGKKSSAATQAYETALGYTRISQLAASLPTYLRNLISNTSRYAMENGDVLQEPVLGSEKVTKNYTGGLIKDGVVKGVADAPKASFTREQIFALKFVKRMLKATMMEKSKNVDTKIKGLRDKAALEEELELLSKSKTFDSRTNPLVQSILLSDKATLEAVDGFMNSKAWSKIITAKSPTEILTAIAGMPKNIKNKLGGLYAWSDFMHKYASFRLQSSHGATPTEAAKFVNESYPNSFNVSKLGSKLNRMPLVQDFLPYWESSSKIIINNGVKAFTEPADQIAKVKRGEMKMGDVSWRRSIGFAVSSAASALAMKTGFEAVSGGVALLHEKAANIINSLNDDDEKTVSDPYTMEKLTAARTFFPSYWSIKPAMMWTSEKGGKKFVHTIMLSNLDGSPLAEDITGYLQAFGNRHTKLTDIAASRFGANMLTQAAWKMVAGDEYNEGLVETATSQRQDKTEALLKKLVDSAIEFALPVPSRWKNKFDRYKFFKEQLASKEITQEEFDRRFREMMFTELFPFRVYNNDSDQIKRQIQSRIRDLSESYRDEAQRPIGTAYKQASASLKAQVQAGEQQPAALVRPSTEKRLTKVREEIEPALIKELGLTVKDARTAYGEIISDAELAQLLKETNLSKDVINAIMQNKEYRYIPKPSRGKAQPAADRKLLEQEKAKQ